MVETLSKRTVKKAEILSGTGRIKKRRLPAERQQEKNNWADRAKEGNTHTERWLT